MLQTCFQNVNETPNTCQQPVNVTEQPDTASSCQRAGCTTGSCARRVCDTPYNLYACVLLICWWCCDLCWYCMSVAISLFAAAAAAACCYRCWCHATSYYFILLLVFLSLFSFDAIFSLVVLVQAQRHTTLLTPVCRGRRACTPPCSIRVSLLLLLLCTFSAAIVGRCLLLLLGRCLLLPPPSSLLLRLLQALLLFLLPPLLMLYPHLTCMLCVVFTLNRLFFYPTSSVKCAVFIRFFVLEDTSYVATD